MDNQKLYDKINQLPSFLGWQGHGVKVMIAKDSVLELVRKLDEPQKVVVPKFVAEWIVLAREKCLTLRQALDHYSLKGEIQKWLQFRGNQELFARAWLDGYDVEREKLYTVEIPNNGGTLVLASINDRLYLQNGYKHNPTKLTESEIRKDFDWAWQAGFAKPVEENEK